MKHPLLEDEEPIYFMSAELKSRIYALQRVEENGKQLLKWEGPPGISFYIETDKEIVAHRELGPAFIWKIREDKSWVYYGQRVSCKSQEEYEKIFPELERIRKLQPYE